VSDAQQPRVIHLQSLSGQVLQMAGDTTNSVSPQRPRIRMVPELYGKLRREILERDGWQCQTCGRSTNLDVHHTKRRSALGDDRETNLITLCRECHQILHGLHRSSWLVQLRNEP